MTPRESVLHLIDSLADILVEVRPLGAHLFLTVNGQPCDPRPVTRDMDNLASKTTALPWIYKNFKRAARTYHYDVYPLYETEQGEKLTYRGIVDHEAIGFSGTWLQYYKEADKRYLLGKCKRYIYVDDIRRALDMPFLVGDGVVEADAVYGEGPCTVTRTGYSCARLGKKAHSVYDRRAQLELDYDYDAQGQISEYARINKIDSETVVAAYAYCKTQMPKLKDLFEVKAFVQMARRYMEEPKLDRIRSDP